MKRNVKYAVHAAVLAVSVILAAVSSSVAYPMGDMKLIWMYGIAAVVLDIVMLAAAKKESVLWDILMLATVVLATLCFCRVLAGRADLMGYVWFSDLEAGNPTAVASLNLATCSMAGFLIAAVMNIVFGFQKRKNEESKRGII